MFLSGQYTNLPAFTGFTIGAIIGATEFLATGWFSNPIAPTAEKEKKTYMIWFHKKKAEHSVQSYTAFCLQGL